MATLVPFPKFGFDLNHPPAPFGNVADGRKPEPVPAISRLGREEWTKDLSQRRFIHPDARVRHCKFHAANGMASLRFTPREPGDAVTRRQSDFASQWHGIASVKDQVKNDSSHLAGIQGVRSADYADTKLCVSYLVADVTGCGLKSSWQIAPAESVAACKSPPTVIRRI
jgi:hypothetical protein